MIDAQFINLLKHQFSKRNKIKNFETNFLKHFQYDEPLHVNQKIAEN